MTVDPEGRAVLPAPEADRADAALAGNAASSIIRGAFARGGTFVVSTACIAVAFAVVVRVIGPEGFGRLAIAIAIATIGQTIGDVAVASITQRLLLAKPAAERPALQAQLVGFRFVVMPVVMLIAVALSVAAGYRGELLETIVVVCASAILVTIGGGLVAPLVIELRAGRASVVEFSRQLLIAAGLLIGAAAGTTIVGYGFVYVVASAAAIGVALALVEPQWRRIRLPDRATIQLVIRETAWLALAITVNAMFLKILTVVASLRTNDAEVGIFAAATRVTEIVAALSLLMASVAYPLMSRAAIDEDYERFANAVHRVIDGVLLLMGAAAVTLIVGSGTLISIFAGNKFADAGPVLQIQSVALIAAATTQALVWALLALRAERMLVITNLLGLSVLVVLGVALIGPYGAEGAAYSAVAGEGALLVATLVALHRRRADALPGAGRAARSLALTAVCVGIGLALPIPEIPATIVALLVFAGGGFALRLVPAELLAAIPGRSRSAV